MDDNAGRKSERYASQTREMNEPQVCEIDEPQTCETDEPSTQEYVAAGRFHSRNEGWVLNKSDGMYVQ